MRPRLRYSSMATVRSLRIHVRSGFHAIAGFNWIDSSDKTKAYLPTAPLATVKCGTDAVNAGLRHQAIAIKTGGLRFPSCQPNYTTIFKEMAKGVIDGAKVACEFPIPPPRKSFRRSARH